MLKKTRFEKDNEHVALRATQLVSELTILYSQTR